MPITRQTYFQPTQITGCSLWLDGADNSTIYSSYPGTLAGNTSTVTQWNDKSGANNHVYQNGAATCPTFTLASNALNFAGGGGLWNSVGYALSSNVSFFTVMISPGTGWGTWGTLWGHFRSGSHDSDIQFRQESLTNGYVSWHTNNNNINYLAIPTAGTKVMYSCTMSNGVNMFLQNSYSGSTTSVTYTEGTMTIAGGTVAPFWVGRSDSSEVYNGYICEIVYYNQKVSDTQRQQVETYLAQKWGLTSSLSTGHPGLTSIIYRNLQTTFTKTQYYTAFSPQQISGCILWLDAADASSVTTSGTTVTAIRDKSARATVLTSPAGFTYPNNTFNGAYPSFYNTSASGGRLGYNTTYSLGSQNTVFIVGQLTSPSAGNQFFDFIDGYTSSSRFFLFSSPNFLNNYVYGTNGSSSGQVSGAITTAQMTSPFCWSVAFDTSTTISSTLQYVNGTQLVQSPSTLGAAISSYTGIIIGQRFTQSSESVVGHICEFIIFNNVLTATQRQQVESYLAQKWGLVSSLPTTGHIQNTFPAGSPTAIQPYTTSVKTSLTNIAKATGGIITNVGGRRFHTFINNGTFSIVFAMPGKIFEVFDIGGGGGGGGFEGGGGGGGGLVTYTSSLSVGNYSITIGTGGTGGTASSVAGGNGTSTLFSSLVTAIGGGGGGSSFGGSPANGGCGGGGAYNQSYGTGSQGFNGAVASPSLYWGGGGGGTSASATNNNGGAGTLYYGSYYGGGGGGGGNQGPNGTGGIGGGGDGGGSGTPSVQYITPAPVAGAANTGGGGGGHGYNGTTGAIGGTGICIVSYIYP